jgi:hypothetical protein
MARVNLDSYAFDDPRFELLASAVRHFRDRWHALGYVTRVWHACASRSVKQLRAVELAGLLGYRKPLEQHEDAATAFCDAAGLGERLEDGTIRIRGTDGRTDYLEDDGDELADQAVAKVAEAGPMKRADIMRALELQRTQRASFYRAVRKAVETGKLVDVDGMVAAPGADFSRLVASPSQQRHLVLVPAPVLVPDRNEGDARDGALVSRDTDCLAGRRNGVSPVVATASRERRDGDGYETEAQMILDTSTVNGADAQPLTERRVHEALSEAVIVWLNGVHRAAGKLSHHRGFDPRSKPALSAAKRWRKLKLKPEDVIAVCELRIAGWKRVGPDWLSNCTPETLFRPDKFAAALDAWRAGFTHVPAASAARRGERPGVRTAAQEDYTTEDLPV